MNRHNWDILDDNFNFNAGGCARWAALVVVCFIALSFLGWGIDILVTQPMNRVTITNDAQRQISVNNHFHQILADVEADHVALAQYDQQLHEFDVTHNLNNLSYSDKQEYAQLTQNIQATNNDLAQLVNTYNSDMQNPDWRGADNSLPRRLDQNGNPTQTTPVP